MTPTAMAMLLLSCVLVVGSAITALAAAALLWSVRQIRPIWQLEEDVEALTNQVTKLRTRKAAAASPRTKPGQPILDYDPRLAGLSKEDAALFRFAAEQDAAEEVEP